MYLSIPIKAVDMQSIKYLWLYYLFEVYLYLFTCDKNDVLDDGSTESMTGHNQRWN